MTQPPVEISVGLGSLIDFVGARPTQRTGVVRDIADMYLSDYSPGTDYYKQIREGIRDGILLGDDAQRLPRIVAEANPKKRDNYQALADGWLAWRRRKNLEFVGDTMRWHEQQLTVRVSPAFVWRQRRSQHLVLPYLKEPVLAGDAAQAATRILELTFGEARGRAAVLDVRRGVLHEARRRRPRDYDTFLASEVSAFLWMYRSIGGAA